MIILDNLGAIGARDRANKGIGTEVESKDFLMNEWFLSRE